MCFARPTRLTGHHLTTGQARNGLRYLSPKRSTDQRQTTRSDARYPAMDSTIVLTQVGNANTGNSVQNSSIATTVTTTESGAQLQLTQVQVETDSRTQEGNDYSGTFEQLDLASSSTTLTQTSAGVSVQQTNVEATQDAEVGNTISGAYSLNEIDVNAYTLQQTEADGVVTTETGTQYAQAMETGNSALSTSSRTEDDWIPTRCNRAISRSMARINPPRRCPAMRWKARRRG